MNHLINHKGVQFVNCMCVKVALCMGLGKFTIPGYLSVLVKAHEMILIILICYFTFFELLVNG